MPLFEKARVEVYLPDLPKPAYQELLEALDREFTYTFGGCTIVRGLEGSYSLGSLGADCVDDLPDHSRWRFVGRLYLQF